MIKDFLMRKMLEKQLKGVPKEEQDKMITLITKNPELFQKIALEIKAKMDSGKSQMDASVDVMKNYQDEIKKLYQA